MNFTGKSKVVALLLTLVLFTSIFYTKAFALSTPMQTQTWVCGNNPNNNNKYEFYKLNVNKYSISSNVDIMVELGATIDETRLTQLFSDYDIQYNKLLYYGNPDKDRDGKITFLFWNGLGGAMGRYNPFHQNTYYDGKDIIEMNLNYCLKSPSMYSIADCKGTIYHELQHMIQNQYDPNELPMINEGCSTYIQKDLGYNMRMRISEYVSGEWNFQTQTYSKDFLFMNYLAQKYGGKSLVKEIIQNSGTGLNTIINILAQKGYSNVTAKDLFKDFVTTTKLDKGDYDVIDYDIWSQAKYVSIPTTNLNSTSINGTVTGWKTNWTYVKPSSSSVKITTNSCANMQYAILSLDSTITNGKISSVGSNPVVNYVNAGDSITLSNLTTDKSLLYITPLYTPDNTNTIRGWNMTTNWGVTIEGASTLTVEPAATPIATPVPVTTPSTTLSSISNTQLTPTATPIPDMTVPTNISSTSTTTGIMFTWNAINNATQYDCNVDGQVKTVTTNSITLRDLRVGSGHTFKVRAKNGSLVSQYSSEITKYTLLTTPSYLRKNSISTSSIKVLWNLVPNATSYVLLIDGVEVNVGNTQIYNCVGLKSKTSHTFAVKGVNENTCSEFSSILTAYTK
jgi:hypothetical protein